MTPASLLHLRPRAPVLVAAALLAAAMGLVVGSGRLLADAEAKARKAAQDLGAMENRLREAEDNASLSQQAAVEHARIRQTAIGRAADRVAWIEHMEHLRSTLPLTRLEYEIGPEHPLLPAETGSTEEPAFFASTLHLRAQVPHEDALVTLIGRLGLAAAFLRPSHCHFSRAQDGETTMGLNARCEVDWLHLRLPPQPLPPQAETTTLTNGSRR